MRGFLKTETLVAAGVFAGRTRLVAIEQRPAPPPGHGLHHYRFRLYAPDTMLHVGPGLDKDGLMAAMQGHILVQGELVGTYQR